MTSNKIKTDVIIRPLPMIISELYETVSYEYFIKLEIFTPLAYSIKNIPIISIPPIHMMMVSHMIIPVQQRTTTRKNSEAAIANNAAPTKTKYPFCKSYDQVAYVLYVKNSEKSLLSGTHMLSKAEVFIVLLKVPVLQFT